MASETNKDLLKKTQVNKTKRHEKLTKTSTVRNVVLFAAFGFLGRRNRATKNLFTDIRYYSKH